MVSGLLLRYVLNNLEIHHRILRFWRRKYRNRYSFEYLGQVYHGGAVVPVLLGMLLMVLVFQSKDFVISKQLVKPT
jgi:hypothetical protein